MSEQSRLPRNPSDGDALPAYSANAMEPEETPPETVDPVVGGGGYPIRGGGSIPEDNRENK